MNFIISFWAVQYNWFSHPHYNKLRSSPRNWTCDSRPLLLTWAGWGVGTGLLACTTLHGWGMLSIYKHEVRGCRTSGFLLRWEGGRTAIVMRRLWRLVPPLRDGSLGFCMHGIAGTSKAKIKKASIVRQQKSSGKCFPGSSANRFFFMIWS